MSANRLSRCGFWLLLLGAPLVVLCSWFSTNTNGIYEVSNSYLPSLMLQPAAVLRQPIDFYVGTSAALGQLDQIPLPFTIVARAVFTSGSDPQAGWGFVFCPCPLDERLLLIFADGFYRFEPIVPDTTWFVHIRPIGQPNEVKIEFATDGGTTLWINNEFAGQGKPGKISGLEVLAINGENKTSTLVFESIRIMKAAS